jgi:hypothetical protein
MRRQVSTYDADGGVIKLEPKRNTSLVSQHAHDTDTDTVGMNILDATSVGVSNKDANKKAHQVTLHQKCVSSGGIVTSVLGLVESGKDPIDPELRTLLGLGFNRDIDCIEIHHFLKANGDDIRWVFQIFPPVFGKKLVQRFVLSLGVHIPCSEKEARLREFSIESGVIVS